MFDRQLLLVQRVRRSQLRFPGRKCNAHKVWQAVKLSVAICSSQFYVFPGIQCKHQPGEYGVWRDGAGGLAAIWWSQKGILELVLHCFRGVIKHSLAARGTVGERKTHRMNNMDIGVHGIVYFEMSWNCFPAESCNRIFFNNQQLLQYSITLRHKVLSRLTCAHV